MNDDTYKIFQQYIDENKGVEAFDLCRKIVNSSNVYKEHL